MLVLEVHVDRLVEREPAIAQELLAQRAFDAAGELGRRERA